MIDEDVAAIQGESRSPESARVEAWRIDQCLRLGFSVEMSWSIALSDADLNQLRVLIAAGCPLSTAARIV